MALKDLFTMVKADRYTADGREEVIKAQEAETEDARRTYQIGEISEATGLQKTATGWVKPKKGAAGKTEKPSTAERMKAYADAMKKKNGDFNGRYEKLKKSSNEQKQNQLAELNRATNEESKPDAADQRDQIGGEIKENLEAAKYYYQKAQSFSPTDPSYKTYMTKAKQYNDEAKAQADEYGFDFEEMHNSGITQAVNKYAQEQSKPAENKAAGIPKPSVQEYIKAKDRVKKYEEQYKKEMDDYEYMERIKANGVDSSIFNPMYGGKPKPLTENESYMEELNKIKAYESADAAPRVLTGDTKIRVRRETKDKTYTPESINGPREKLDI